ncbi:SRPBCC family protein [Mucilaginibacter mali]|uniref:SRPBCC family protein n=1 Tax=Mucilaginibacter mali TaxID=2740462 RepID=A0A7D4ULI7_9SPHI|nr:SRPBCC family protein [Mucilaginibacter mali]QKJ29981.1 SRPBCC family protein [Mucilaginibacter mali]
MATLTASISGHSMADTAHINLKWPERYVSVIAGVKMGFSGLVHIFSSPVTSLFKLGTSGYLLSRGLTGHCELYEKVGKTSTEPVSIAIRTSVTIDKPREELYTFWRRLENLPLFMNHLKSVEMLDNGSSRWSLKLPVDIAALSWDAEITHDEPGELIAWSSVPGANLQTTGKVRFIDTPEPGVTLIHVVIMYHPPAGLIGATLAHLINPMFKKMVEDDIQNFKRYMDLSNSLPIAS